MRTIYISIFVAIMTFSLGSCVATFGPRPAPGVVVIKHRPMHYKIVRVKGKKYYHWDNRHYQKVRGGYIQVRF